MQKLKLLKHVPGAPGLRLFGLGPNFLPSKGLSQLRELLNKHAFWAKNRNYKSLRQLLHRSTVVVTLWQNKRLVGFGRATTDQVYRAVLWDIVVSKDVQRVGLGKIIVEELLKDKKINSAEKVYLMTTDSKDFYKQLGFEVNMNQSLMMLN